MSDPIKDFLVEHVVNALDARTPYEEVVADWLARPRERPLAWYEEQHKRRGFVFATPAFYVLCRPVRKYAPIEQILDVEHVFDFEQCDTWYVFLMAGDIKQALRMMPWELPWMAWSRDNDPTAELRFYETRRVMRFAGLTE